jgi:putative ABC transport system substrate-binding protein
MKRRDVWAATAILASPIFGSAATVDARTSRLGILAFSAAEISGWDAFVAELAKQGHAVGRNLVIERQYWREVGLDAAASALVALKVDVIFAIGGTPPALAVKRATSSIPIVFESADPVGFGLVSSLARPGGNLTGVSMQGSAITSKQMESMAAALGTLKSMAYILPSGARSFSWYPSYVAAATAAATALGVRIEFHDVSGLAGFEPLIRQLVNRDINAVEVFDGGTAAGIDYERVAALCLRYRLPAIGPARLGFLLECRFAAELIEQRLAYFVSRILNGAKPAELPVEEFSTLQLVLNMKTARALGLSISRSLVIRADEVIE